MGHELKEVAHQGIANTIVVDQERQTLHGIADHRRATAKSSGD